MNQVNLYCFHPPGGAEGALGVDMTDTSDVGLTVDG